MQNKEPQQELNPIQQLLEPIVIVGRNNEANTDELKQLLDKAGYRLVEPANDPKRGMSVAMVVKGSPESTFAAIKGSKLLSRMERRSILRELKGF